VAGQLGAKLTFAACTGATSIDVLANQLGSLSAATTYVTVSAGGNDAGFAPVITQCAKPWPTTCWGDIGEANSYITRSLPGRLDKLYAAIRTRAPRARVVAVGYPRVFNATDCRTLARISPGEQSTLNSTADLLDQTIKARAAAHGFVFADPRPAFTHHAVCDSTEWLNGLSNPVTESYHPNVAGQTNGYTPLVKAALRG
jgi:lysophospholipase L1-like esterase